MSESRKEIYSGIFFAALSILYFIGTFLIKSYSAFGDNSFDSTVIPRILGIFLLMLSIFQTTSGLSKAKTEKNKDLETVAKKAVKKEKNLFEASQDSEEELIEEEKIDKKSIVITFMFLVIYAALLETIGFLIMTSVFLMAQMTLLTKSDMRKKKFPFIVGLSVVFSTIVYFLFTEGFSLILPAGILG